MANNQEQYSTSTCKILYVETLLFLVTFWKGSNALKRKAHFQKQLWQRLKRENSLHHSVETSVFTLCECWCWKQKSLGHIDKIEYFIRSSTNIVGLLNKAKWITILERRKNIPKLDPFCLTFKLMSSLFSKEVSSLCVLINVMFYFQRSTFVRADEESESV